MGGDARVSFQRHSFDLSCEKLYEFPFFIVFLSLFLSLALYFGLLAFLLFGFVSILSRRDTGTRGWRFVRNSVARRGNVILTYRCNFVPVWRRDGKSVKVRKREEVEG